MRKTKENRHTKKAVIFLVLASIIAQGLAGCSVNPSDEEKEEARKEVSQVREEIESDFSEIREEMSQILEESKSGPTENKQTGNYQAKAEELSTVLLETKAFEVSTVQYAIMDGDEIVLSNMVGVNDAWSKPVLSIGSCSKVYTTAAVMMLVDQGKIDLDTPVVQYMPDFTMADARYKEITPRMLLNHASGLYGTSRLYGNGMTYGAPSTMWKDTFLESKKEELLIADPGEIVVYCNDGFILAECLIEEVSGMSYTDFIENNISEPLGLTYTTTAFSPALKHEEITLVAGPDGEAMPVLYPNIMGTGGIYSTTEEMCKFARLFMGAYPEILSEKSAQMTMEPEYLKGIWVEDIPNATGYGLGWDDVTVDRLNEHGIRAVNKGGDLASHHGDLTILPDHNISMAVLTGGGSSLFNAMFSIEVLLEYLVSKGIIETIQEDTFEPAAPVKVEMPEDLKKYEGLYGMGSTFARTTQITINDGELLMSGATGIWGMLYPDTTFVYTGNNEFTSEDGTINAYFKEESNGETYLVQRKQLIAPGLGRQISEGHEFQKLEPQKLSESVKSAWQARVDKRYFCVDEVYNSLYYTDPNMSVLGLVYRPAIDLEIGYVGALKIIDENQALNAVKIPVSGGRENFDMNFYEENGKSYLNKIHQILISEDHVVPFDLSGGKNVVIGSKGYAEWFFIDADTAGKEFSVTIPEKCAVYIYDENMTPSYSMDAGEQTFTLPSDGYIVFVGAAGAEFKLAL